MCLIINHNVQCFWGPRKHVALAPQKSLEVLRALAARVDHTAREVSGQGLAPQLDVAPHHVLLKALAGRSEGQWNPTCPQTGYEQ